MRSHSHHIIRLLLDRLRCLFTSLVLRRRNYGARFLSTVGPYVREEGDAYSDGKCRERHYACVWHMSRDVLEYFYLAVHTLMTESRSPTQKNDNLIETSISQLPGLVMVSTKTTQTFLFCCWRVLRGRACVQLFFAFLFIREPHLFDDPLFSALFNNCICIGSIL